MKIDTAQDIKKHLRYREYKEGCEMCKYYAISPENSNTPFCTIVENIFGIFSIKASGNCDKFTYRQEDKK